MRLKPHHLALALSALLAFPALATEPKETKATPAGTPATPRSESAMRIHVDPATGQVVPRPVPGNRAALGPAPAVELPPLKVENGKTKAGGKRVRLDDRFMMEMSVSAGPDGTVSHACQAEQDKGASPAKEHGHER